MTSANSSEKFLSLPGGCTLAYEHNGNLSSQTVVLMIHGAMAIGSADPLPPGIKGKDVHFITPTLPGWGLSSPRPAHTPFHKVIPQYTTLLLNHLCPTGLDDPDTKLYIGGGSFGTIPAQIPLGAPHDAFPWHRRLKGVLLGSGFPAIYKYPSFGSHMSLVHYLGVCPLAARSRLFTRFFSLGVSLKVGTPDKAKKFLDELLFDKMSDEEKSVLQEAQGRPLSAIREPTANNVYKSISKSWEGFMDIPVACHEDWGLREDVFKISPGLSSSPEEVDASLPRVLVTASEGDKMTPLAFSEWCANNYKNTELVVFPGGHIGAMGHMQEIWERLLSYS